MKPRLILHIGTMKTGSTTIQNRLARSRDYLSERGIYYPNTYTDTTHVRLALVFSSFPKHADYKNVLFAGTDPKRYLEQVRADFIKEMENLPGGVRTVVLSAELFSQYVRRVEDISALHALLAPFFSDMAVVCYLRRQDGHFASFYSEMLRNGMIKPPSMERLQEEKQIYDYWALLSSWAEVFGDSAIVPRLFERDTDKSYDAVADFLGLIGLDALPEEAGARDRNPSVNLYGQRILRDVGRLIRQAEGPAFARGLMWKRVNGLVTAALPGQGWRPTRAQAEEFVARFAAENERVRAKWFPERRTLFSTEFGHFPVSEPSLDAPELNEAQTKVLFTVMKELIERQWTAKRLKISQKPEDAQKSQALIRLLRANPADHATRLELVARQMAEQDFNVARFHLNEVLKREPDHGRARVMLKRLERLEQKHRAGPADAEGETAPALETAQE